jgi:hypothetical protein
MKTIYFLGLFGLVLCLSNPEISVAQSREDNKSIIFTQKSGKLLKATGWMKSPKSGKWISHPNFAGDVDDQVLHNGFGFNWIQTSRFEFNGKKYFALCVEYTSGAYKYESIHQGWYSFQSEMYFVMDLDHYAQFAKSLDSVGKHTELKTLFNEPRTLMNISETDVLNDLTKKMNENPDQFDNNRDSYDMCSIKIDYVQDNGKTVVRFDPCILKVMLIDYSDITKEVPGYFETDPASFKALILPLTPDEEALLKK